MPATLDSATLGSMDVFSTYRQTGVHARVSGAVRTNSRYSRYLLKTGRKANLPACLPFITTIKDMRINRGGFWNMGRFAWL